MAAVLRGREDPVLRERRIDKKTVYRALTITTLGLGVVICTTLVMVFNTPGRGGMIDGNLWTACMRRPPPLAPWGCRWGSPAS